MQMFNLQRHQKKHPNLQMEKELMAKSVPEVNVKYEIQASDEKGLKTEVWVFPSIRSPPPYTPPPPPPYTPQSPPPHQSPKQIRPSQQQRTLLNFGREESELLFVKNNFAKCLVPEESFQPEINQKTQIGFGIPLFSGSLSLNTAKQKPSFAGMRRMNGERWTNLN